MNYSFLVYTYATERLKTLNVMKPGGNKKWPFSARLTCGPE